MLAIYIFLWECKKVKIYLFTKQQNFGYDQIESICRRQLYVAKVMISPFDKVENTVGKGENAGYQHFLLFRQCFQEASFSGSLKVGIIW